MSQGSMILKLISLPISIILICLGITTILGGHITPGGGFQGGAMIASGVILSVIVYGVGNSPLEFSIPTFLADPAPPFSLVNTFNFPLYFSDN